MMQEIIRKLPPGKTSIIGGREHRLKEIYGSMRASRRRFTAVSDATGE